MPPARSPSFDYQQVASMPVTNYLWAVHIFMGLWVNAFILCCHADDCWSCVKVVLHVAITKYVSPLPVCRAYYMRFHLGLWHLDHIIAIVQFIRLVVAYIQRKMSKPESRVKKIIMCLVQCCLWCLENASNLLARMRTFTLL